MEAAEADLNTVEDDVREPVLDPEGRPIFKAVGAGSSVADSVSHAFFQGDMARVSHLLYSVDRYHGRRTEIGPEAASEALRLIYNQSLGNSKELMQLLLHNKERVNLSDGTLSLDPTRTLNNAEIGTYLAQHPKDSLAKLRELLIAARIRLTQAKRTLVQAEAMPNKTKGYIDACRRSVELSECSYQILEELGHAFPRYSNLKWSWEKEDQAYVDTRAA